MNLTQRKQMHRMISNLSKHKRTTESLVCQWWPDGSLLFAFDEDLMQRMVFYVFCLFCFGLVALCLAWKWNVFGLKHQNKLPLCWYQVLTKKPLQNPTSRECFSTCTFLASGSRWNSCFTTVKSSGSYRLCCRHYRTTSENACKKRKKKCLKSVLRFAQILLDIKSGFLLFPELLQSCVSEETAVTRSLL